MSDTPLLLCPRSTEAEDPPQPLLQPYQDNRRLRQSLNRFRTRSGNLANRTSIVDAPNTPTADTARPSYFIPVTAITTNEYHSEEAIPYPEAADSALQRRISEVAAAQERQSFFSLIQDVVKVLKDKRASQKCTTDAEEETHDTTEGATHDTSPSSQTRPILRETPVPKAPKKFYYDDVTLEEDALLQQLIREAQEVKARRHLEHDITTVQGSWATLLVSERLSSFGTHLYHQLIAENTFIPVQWESLTVGDRVAAILSLMDSCISCYEDPQQLYDLLTAAGAAHQRFGISGNDFYVFRNCFIASFRLHVPTNVYKSSAADWNRFWRMTIHLLLEGGESKEGLENQILFKQESGQTLLFLLHQIETAHQNSPNLSDHFVQIMLKHANHLYPATTSFASVFSTRRTCDRLFQSVLHIAGNMKHPEENEAYMKELGARHVAYNVDRATLELFEIPFLMAAKEVLGEAYTETVGYLTRRLYTTMTDGIAAGMNAGKNTGENRRAPDGSAPFCLLFTDIESSTNLWQWNSDIMKKAVAQHHRIIRNVIADYGGYEVKTAGDSFLIAAKDMLVGLKIAVAIQLELMRNLPIVPGFEMLDEVQGGGDPSAWSNQTLRVRIGMEHCTQATATYDTIHRRYDYYGPSVNQCARIEAAAAGGQILMSRESFKALKAIPEFHTEPCPPYLRDLSGATPMDDRGLDHFVAMGDMGRIKLKGISKPVRLASMVPMCFAGREFTAEYLSRVS